MYYLQSFLKLTLALRILQAIIFYMFTMLYTLYITSLLTFFFNLKQNHMKRGDIFRGEKEHTDMKFTCFTK